MLRNDEIKEICQKNGLTRKEVYEIRSEFASMCAMAEDCQEDFMDYKDNSTKNNDKKKNSNRYGVKSSPADIYDNHQQQ